MGFGDSFKKIVGGAINPTVWLGTGAAVAGDLLADERARKEASNAREQQDRINQQNYDMQKEFAQHGIRWRVADAIAAGLHPLAAIGASGASSSPSFAMADVPSRSEFRSRMGQNISRAIEATSTMYERRMRDLNIEKMNLENRILEKELNRADNPPFPTGASGAMAGQAQYGWQEHVYPSVAYMNSPTGLVPIMPPNLAEALESDEMNQKQWALRYKGAPNVIPIERPANSKLPPGAAGWLWSYKMQEWQPKTREQLENLGRIATERRMRAWYKDHDVRMRYRYPERRANWAPKEVFR